MANKTWSIKDSVQNLLPEDTYMMRLESCEAGMTKGNEKNPPCPNIKTKWVVVGGEHDDAKCFWNFMMRTDMLGLLGAMLAGTQAFDEAEELPDDAEELSRIMESKLGGKVYEIEYKHRTPRGSDRTFADYRLVGPQTSNFS